MLVGLKNLLHLPVETKSGSKLGKVVEINLDTDGHLVREYIVRPALFSQRTFLIRPVQVVAVTAEKMIVEDGVLKETELSASSVAAV